MRLGVEFPDREIGTDPAVIKDWAQAAEDLGYEFIIMGEHVLVPDQRYHEGLLGPYTIETIFRDPIRVSPPTTRRTASTSVPTRPHSPASSFMNEMRAASMALAAYFASSA